MSRLVIIGQSPAVVAAIKKIREVGAEREMTLISADGELPYDRTLFPAFIARKIKEKDLFCEAESFYSDHKVELVLGKEITRINFNRRKIFMSERTQIDYDDLMIADVPEPRFAELKGIRRTGVFHLGRLESVKKLVKYLPFVETVALEVVSPQGLEAALALKDAGKDVLIVTSESLVLSGVLGEDLSRILARLLERRGVRVFAETSVEGILGDVEMKAVRLKSGKVIACEMLVWDDVTPDLRFLADGDLVMGERIMVKGTMETNLAHVYAIDAVMEMQEPAVKGSYHLPTSIGQRQAEVAVGHMNGQEGVLTVETFCGRTFLETVFSAEDVQTAEGEMAALRGDVPDSESSLEGAGRPSENGQGG